MAVQDGQPVNAAYTNTKLMSKTVDNTVTGAQTISNTTDSSSTSTGAIITTGGVGIAKKLYVGTDASIGGSLTVTGDLTVQGTTTTFNTSTVDIEDTNILVNKGGNDASSEGAGITVDRTSTKGSIIYSAGSASKWKVGALGSEVQVADISSTQTLTNKTLTGNTAVNLISGSGTMVLNATGTVTVPNTTDTLVGKATTDTLTNKILTGNTAVNLISGSGTLVLNTTGTATVPNATDTLVGKATTDTLTNKTLTGNTAANLIRGSGTLVLNTTGTATIPNATDTLVGKATTDTLTNKSIDADTNTITNIDNNEIKAAAAISVNKLAALTASRAVVSDGSGFIAAATTTSTEIGYVNGVTSAIQTQLDLKALDASVVHLAGIETVTGGKTFSAAQIFTNALRGDVSTDSATTGATAALPTPAKMAVRLTNGSLTSIGTITGPASSQFFVLLNKTGNSINILNDSGAGSTSVLTGTGATLALANNASLWLFYDPTSTRWVVVGGSGSGGGSSFSDASFEVYDDGDNTKKIALQASGITTGTTRTWTAPDADLTVVGTATTQTLTNKSMSGGSNTFTLIPANTALTGQVPLVNAGVQNYITNAFAEVDASGWATYADAAGASPVDGTGGSPTETYTRSTSSPLNGAASFLLTKDAANRQGEGFSYAFTLDREDQAQLMQLTFNYEVASGTYSGGTSSTDSDLTVWVYDVTNTTMIQMSPYKLDGAVVNQQYRFRGEFQTASNSTSYRLIIHTATTSASAYTVKFDNFRLSPGVVVQGNIITDWAAYTPTFTGFGTATSVDFQWRRNVSDIEIRGKFVAGTTTATEARISLPTGLTSADTTKIATIQLAGGLLFRNAASTNNSLVPLIEPSVTYFTIGQFSNSAVPLTKVNGNTVGTGETVPVFAKLPILGWASNVLVSSDIDSRAVAALITGDPASATSGNPIIVPTAGFDSHGAYNATTGRYTVPTPGIYKVYGALQSASSATTLTIYKNAVSTSLAGNLDSNGEATFNSAVNCVAGDIIDLRPGGTVDATNMTLNFERLSGPSQIAASENISARYYASATSISGSLATVSWSTKDWDTHGGMTTGTYTIPAAGKYQVNAGLGMPGTYILNKVAIIEIQKNGTVVTRNKFYAAAAVTQLQASIADEVSCVAGDTIRIQVSNDGTTPTIVSSNFENFFSINRLGL